MNSTSKKSRRKPEVERLDPRIMLARDSVYITEFLANNDTGLTDQDGHFSDWIELHNPTNEPINLAGWSLTDSADEPTKWTLPSVTITANGFQTVFASGKDRQDPNSELHANFKLSSDGEYLALVKPDQSIAHEFAPAYPRQTPDVSFGFAKPEIPLLGPNFQASFRVPTEDHITDAWQTNTFDDNDWQTTVGGIGYDQRERVWNAGFESSTLSSWGSRGPVQATSNPAGVTPTEGDHAAIATTFRSVANRSAAEFYLDLPRSSLDSVNIGDVQRVAALRREVTVETGSVVTIDWNFLTNDDRDGDFAFAFVSDSDTIRRLADPTSLLVASATNDYARETGFQQFSHTFENAGTYTIGIGVAQAIDLEFDSALIVDNLHVDGLGDIGPSYESIVQTQLTEPVSSVQTRYEFQFDTDQPLIDLLLRVQYDDGFAAFLNGQLIASANAPAALDWDSTATSTRPNGLPLEFEEFSVPLNTLQHGANVLAMVGLNAESDLDDFLLNAQLAGASPISDVASYLHQPTPGSHNLSTSSPVITEYSEVVKFDRAAGFYDSSFHLGMSTAADATIRFTTDGSQPTDQNGTTYTQPIPVDSTTIVRAAAFKDGLLSREIQTASYLFLDQIVGQSTESAVAAGFPATWEDYELDPEVIGPDGQDLFGGKYAATIRDDLLSLPSMSLVMNQDDWFGNAGLFQNSQETGDEWERVTSVELIDPHGVESFQVDAGVRIHGGLSRSADKLSMRLLFRSEYGNSKLEYPLFGDEGPNQFDSVVLRSSGSEFKIGFHYIRDQTVRQLEHGTGNPSAQGRFVHVYINGLYWGVYNLMERIDAQFAENRDGGDKSEYDVITAEAGEVRFVPVAANGTLDAWNHLFTLAQAVGDGPDEAARTAAFMRLQGRNPDGSVNPNLESHLDVDSLINHLVINSYAGNTDWPSHNYYAYRRRDPESEGFKFVVWDAEFTLETLEPLSIVRFNRGPATFLPGLLASEAFRVQFADRIEQLTSPGGPLYVNPDSPEWNVENPENNNPAKIYAEIADAVSPAIVAESARWGDGRQQLPGDPFSRDENWLTVVDEKLTQFFPSRTAALLDIMRSDDLYRDPPAYTWFRGRAASESILVLTPYDDHAEIYYTLDGTDPRMIDGSVSPNALRYDGPIVVGSRATVRARSLTDTKWSAIGDALTPDQVIDATDVDRICQAIRADEFIEEYDLNGDSMLSKHDLDFLLESILQTGAGDANLDGQFTSTDLVLVFMAAEFEDGAVGNSFWSEGDWNCDGEFDSQDLLLAFQRASYEPT